MKSGEFDLIEWIHRRAEKGSLQRIGIGDDCSSITVPSDYELLTSTDLLLENIHFRLDWTDLFQLGEKSVSVNISDISAMGGRPVCVHLGLGLPDFLSDAQVTEYLDGVFSALRRYDVFLAGGDTCRSSGPLMISITVQGLCLSGRAVMRSGALCGDDIWVSGTLGDSGLALRFLQQKKALLPSLANRHFRPEARVALGRVLGEKNLASAMLDLSDGLAGDMRHLLRASQVGAQIQLVHLPLSEDFKKFCDAEPELFDLALVGGEDYELLFTSAQENRVALEVLSKELNLPLSRIGIITDETSLDFRDADGEIYAPGIKGYDHFASTEEHHFG